MLKQPLILMLTRVHPNESWMTFWNQGVSTSFYPNVEEAQRSMQNLSGTCVVLEVKLLDHNCVDPKNYKENTRIYMNMPIQKLVREFFEHSNKNKATQKAEGEDVSQTPSGVP